MKMDLLCVVLLSLAMFVCTSSAKCASTGGNVVFDVTRYGAKGDGETLDTLAFQKAWKDACSSKKRNPVLLIPSGKNFLLNSVEFKGPCNSPTDITVVILGNITSSTEKSHWRVCDDFISFKNVRNLVVKGSGVIDGNGNKWWEDDLSCGKRPTNLAFNDCKGVRLSGIHSKDSARNHLSISHVDGAIISDIKLTAPESSPNTDGIDISSSTFITVKQSVIASGDDCIAINNHCNNINISRITCGPGHGISVGSLGKDGEVAQVENILVSNCTFIGTTNGARIKTWKDGRGYARNIVYRDINLINVRRPIIINQKYVDKHKLNSEEESSVAISDVKFINFKGTCNETDAITLDCSDSGPGCQNIEIDNVMIKSSTGKLPESVCENAHGVAFHIQPDVRCLGHPDRKEYNELEISQTEY